MIKPVPCLTAAFLALSIAAVAPAAADVTVKNEDMVALRQALMRVNSSYEGMLEAEAKGTLSVPANQLKQIGEGWLRMGKLMPTLFPAGSEGVGKSRAKPEIWNNPEDFRAKLASYAKATEKFQQVAQNGGDQPAVTAAFVEINNACDDCHKAFRTPAQR
jgi:cytochrome c556